MGCLILQVVLLEENLLVETRVSKGVKQIQGVLVS